MKHDCSYGEDLRFSAQLAVSVPEAFDLLPYQKRESKITAPKESKSSEPARSDIFKSEYSISITESERTDHHIQPTGDSTIDLSVLEDFAVSHRNGALEKAEALGVMSAIFSLDSVVSSSFHINTSIPLTVVCTDTNQNIKHVATNKHYVIHENIAENVRTISAQLNVTSAELTLSPDGAKATKDYPLLRYSIPVKICPDILRARCTLSKSKALYRATVDVLFNSKLETPMYFKDVTLLVSMADIQAPIEIVKISSRGQYSETKKLVSWSIHNISSTLGKIEVTFDLMVKGADSDANHNLPVNLPVSVKCQAVDTSLSQLLFNVMPFEGLSRINTGTIKRCVRFDYKCM